MEIRKKLVDPSKYGTKCPYTMNPEFISVHNTYNDAPAENEIAYMIRNNNEVSFHIAVDDKEAVQGIPLERNAWHCGDGGGNGNRKSIGVEICYSLNGGDRYYKAENNAAIIV
ncbi:N-acetylmuramoyl-L-alanine amidase, partial [Bacillus thuringiensis]